jgi:prepilin-type N-terminal cleavage/methylation domain-containing protein
MSLSPLRRPSFRRFPSSARRGFTLIELVVVLIIIATIAGFVIPQVGMIGRSSDMAATAKTQSDIASNVQLFFVQQKRYPQGLDSLVDGSGAIYASDTSNGDTQTRGLPFGGADGTRLQAQLAPGTLTTTTGAEYLRSFTRSGFDWVYDHDSTTINSNNSATIFRGLVADANGTGNAAPSSVNVAEVTGTSLLSKLIPQGLKAGERVVALGVGPRNSAISKTLTNSPIYPGCDGKYYGRYIVYFKVYASGERATMIGTSDSYGRTPDYSQQQFNESLPDGGRQG